MRLISAGSAVRVRPPAPQFLPAPSPLNFRSDSCSCRRLLGGAGGNPPERHRRLRRHVRRPLGAAVGAAGLRPAWRTPTCRVERDQSRRRRVAHAGGAHEDARGAHRAPEHPGGRHPAQLRPFTGHSRYLFPSIRTTTRPMSDGTINAALRRIRSACGSTSPRPDHRERDQRIEVQRPEPLAAPAESPRRRPRPSSRAPSRWPSAVQLRMAAHVCRRVNGSASCSISGP